MIAFKIKDGVLLEVPKETEGTVVVPEGVTEIKGYAFSRCEKVTEVIIPDGVTEIPGLCFHFMDSLKTVRLPKTITAIKSCAFANCRALENVNLPERLKRIESCTFDGCESLRHIILPDSLEVIGDEAFQQSGLEDIFIPNGVKSIGRFAFAYCRSLTGAHLPEGVKLGSYAFDGCDNWEDAPEVEAPLLDSIKIDGITINQYDGLYSKEWRPYLLADIIRQLPNEYRELLGKELTIPSLQAEYSRMIVCKGLEDNNGESFNIRLWSEYRYGRSGVKAEWTFRNPNERYVWGNVSGPVEFGSGVTILSKSKKYGWRVITPASEQGKTPEGALLMGKLAIELSKTSGTEITTDANLEQVENENDSKQ